MSGGPKATEGWNVSTTEDSMTGGDATLAASDMAIVQAVRDGDEAAYAELWVRHHDAAVRAARRITDRFDPEDLAAEAFTRVLAAIRRGKGPTDGFRPYLYASLRTISMNWTSRGVQTAGELETERADPDAAFEEGVLESTITGAAYASLRPEWREALWLVEVEGTPIPEAALHLGLTPNSTSALVYRAREGLKVAWLQHHLQSVGVDEECRFTVDRLGAHERGRLGTRDQARVDEHLRLCMKCTILASEVEQVGQRLAGMLLPALLGAGVISLDGPVVGAAAGASIDATAAGRSPWSGLTTAAGFAAVGLVGVGLVAGVWNVLASNGGAEVIAAPTSSAAPEEPDDPDPTDAAPVPPREVDAPASEEPEPVRPEATDAVVSRDVAPVGRAPSPAPEATRAPDVRPAEPEPEPTSTAKPTPQPTPEPTPEPTPDPDPVVLTPTIAEVDTAGGLFMPAVSGTADPGARIVVSAVETGVEVAEATADDAGVWSLTIDMDGYGPEATFAAVAEAEGVTSKPTAPIGPFAMVSPTGSPLEQGVPEPQLELSGIPGAFVAPEVNGVPTGNIVELVDGSAIRVLLGREPGEVVVIGLRYYDPATGRLGVVSTFEVLVG